VPISLSLQIPLALRRFLDLEADVDDDDDSIVGGGDWERMVCYLFLKFFCGTDIYVDDFINDNKDTAEQDEAGTQLRLSWMQLPDREDGFGQLLAEILEQSLNSRGRNLALREPTEHPDHALVQVRMPPASHDFPLWRVSCRVRLLNFFNENFYIKSI